MNGITIPENFDMIGIGFAGFGWPTYVENGYSIKIHGNAQAHRYSLHV